MRKKIIKNKFLHDYELILIYGKREESDKFRAKHFGIEQEETPGAGIHTYQYNGGVVSIISDDKYHSNITVIHEITHAVQRMLDYLGIDNSYNNTELVANLMSYYINEALKFYKLKK